MAGVQPVPYKYYLRGNPTGTSLRYYYIDTGGAVADTTTETELPSLPDGWQDLEVSWERGWVYYGLYTTYSSPLRFNKGNAKILRHLLFTYGVEASCELVIKKFNPDSGVYDYEDFFAEQIDFSTFSDEKDFVTVAVMEGGFPAKLKARETQDYAIDLWNNPDVEWVMHDGIPLRAKMSWVGATGSDVDEFPLLSYYDTEGSNFYLTPVDQLNTYGSHYIENKSSQDMDITVRVILNTDVYSGSPSFPADGQLRVRSRVYPIAGGTVIDYTLHTDTTHIPASGVNIQFDIEYDYTIPAGYLADIWFEVVDYGTNTHVATSAYSLVPYYCEVNAYFVNTYQATYIPVLHVSKVFEALVNNISDNDTGITVTSSLLDSLDVYITSGDGVRSLQNAMFTTSFESFFKYINSKFNAAFYFDKVSQTCYIESKEAVFDYISSIPYVISSINNVNIKPLTDGAFATLAIGTPKQNYDDKGYFMEVTNGKDEFNTTLEFISPYVRVKQNADYVPKYRDDMYGIEFARVNLDGREFADYRGDTDVFVFHLDPDNSSTYDFPFPIILNGVSTTTINYHILYRQPISVGTWEVENIYSPETAYNFMFSPKRCMFRNGTYFKSLFYYNQGDDFKFGSGAKYNSGDSYMITTEGGTSVINERADEPIATLCDDGDELFIPIVVEFETIEPVNIYSLIRDYPYYAIEFTFREQSYFGFILSVSSKPVIRGKSKFKVLLTRDNDATDLIR